jgi:hypothetical protein
VNNKQKWIYLGTSFDEAIKRMGKHNINEVELKGKAIDYYKKLLKNCPVCGDREILSSFEMCYKCHKKQWDGKEKHVKDDYHLGLMLQQIVEDTNRKIEEEMLEE